MAYAPSRSEGQAEGLYLLIDYKMLIDYKIMIDYKIIFLLSNAINCGHDSIPNTTHDGQHVL